MSTHRRDLLSWALVTFTVLLVAAAAFYVIWPYVQPHVTVRIGDGVYKARVANTDTSRTAGLSDTPSLRQDEALLMVYPNDDKHPIWMKEMNYPLDIVWLNKDKKVVYIVKNAPPDSYPEKFEPKEPARYVLELPAGAVSEKTISIGISAAFDENHIEGWGTN
ncbi:MAG TPA: DUF192 domain-containing protein [Candidatus Saccharimonadales bacterium]|nr:DUF192 domain-containing protein [Candidatus Saccharimonadales bacterium]